MNLFQKNIFSVLTPEFSLLPDTQAAFVKNVISQNYITINIKEIYQIGAFNINSNNWKLISEEGTFVLKRSEVSKFETLTIQAQWSNQLNTIGFPSVRIVNNKEGLLLSSDSNYTYCLSKFEEGNYFGDNIDQWKDLIANFKKLYDHSLENNESVPVERSFFTSEEDLFIEQLKITKGIPKISEEQIKDIINEYQKIKKLYLNNKSKYRRGIFHIDLHPHNLIFTNNKLILLTDFESYQSTTLEISLGFGLYKCLRQLLTMANPSEQVDPVVLPELNRQFKQLFPDHNLIELIELGKADILKRVLFIIKELQETGTSKWLFMLEVQLDALKEIDEINKLCAADSIHLNQ